MVTAGYAAQYRRVRRDILDAIDQIVTMQRHAGHAGPGDAFVPWTAVNTMLLQRLTPQERPYAADAYMEWRDEGVADGWLLRRGDRYALGMDFWHRWIRSNYEQARYPFQADLDYQYNHPVYGSGRRHRFGF